MKSIRIPVLAVAVAGLISLHAQDAPDLKDPRLRTSYALGADIGNNLKSQEIDLDPKAVAAGLSDALAGKSALKPAEIGEILTEFGEQLKAKAAARQAESGEKNIKAGEAFLAENAKKDGVKTTASGLQYNVLKSGTGKSPGPADTVKVHYHGTLIDGTVFDSSVKRGEPLDLRVNGVIPGWTEALQLMKVGDKWHLVIPAKLAYGDKGAGGPIGPNSVLQFDVELLGIEPADKAK